MDEARQRLIDTLWAIYWEHVMTYYIGPRIPPEDDEDDG